MKDPAFLFYPNDYIGGTMGMTFEEKGAYIELLMLQFNRGHMTSHMIGQTVGQLWDKIKDKFTIDEQGLYYNVRLDVEKNKRKSFTDSRKNNFKGVNGYSKKSGHMAGHMTSHMENENENNSIDNKDSKKDITWRNDFSIYLEECKRGYKKFIEDSEKMKIQQKLNPNVNIKLTLEKGFVNYWGTEAGWKKKKASKSSTIDWERTIINSISINKVYYTKQELSLL